MEKITVARNCIFLFIEYLTKQAVNCNEKRIASAR